jgi:hypothetical protein
MVFGLGAANGVDAKSGQINAGVATWWRGLRLGGDGAR